MGLDPKASDQFRDMDPDVSWSHRALHCNGNVVDRVKNRVRRYETNKKPPRELGGFLFKRLRWELNPRVADLQSAALATWLRSLLSKRLLSNSLFGAF